jgi:antitoxin (DNA-binding transcriptional repressor) of toxin-antitoxin stability system
VMGIGRGANPMKATVDEFEKHAREYLDRVLGGETVIVVRDDRAVAEIRPLKANWPSPGRPRSRGLRRPR